jgi:glycerol-3-phosphate acyltransferase PlsY
VAIYIGALMNFQPLFTYGLLSGAYLLGSIPWGVLLTRAFGAVDPRRHGSGNIGATNVARVGGLALGVATLAADVLKGLAPVWLCVHWTSGSPHSEVLPVAAALLSFFGHLFPIYSGFRGGGKGVATAFGGFVPISPMAVLASVCGFAVMALISHRVSLGSLTAALVLPLAAVATTDSWAVSAGAGLASVFIFIRHGDNIRRLIAGAEPTFSLRRRKD